MTSSDLASAHPQPSITSVTRRDILNYLREISSPWWGKLDEVTFLEHLYDLDQPAVGVQVNVRHPVRRNVLR
ncbi:hypothetical protein ABZS98_38985, partial [Streptomyces avermitilis]|uniref:AbiJ-related protein n=1 Tax=Streptomyces avermitilis TaxID=33903 RepID=UPI0033BF09C4